MLCLSIHTFVTAIGWCEGHTEVYRMHQVRDASILALLSSAVLVCLYSTQSTMEESIAIRGRPHHCSISPGSWPRPYI